MDVWPLCESKSFGGNEVFTEEKKVVDAGSQGKNGCWSLGQRGKKRQDKKRKW